MEGLSQRYGQVSMARATVGIAVGGAGTDAALETADAVLMADEWWLPMPCVYWPTMTVAADVLVGEATQGTQTSEEPETCGLNGLSAGALVGFTSSLRRAACCFSWPTDASKRSSWPLTSVLPPHRSSP